MCDDIRLTVQNNRITQAANACPAGAAWFTKARNEDRPEALIEGRPVSYAEAIEAAGEILKSAVNPLTFGLRTTSCDAQRAAVAITDWIGGTVDSTTSVSSGPSGVAFQGVGEVTCTLGELKNRADFFIFWRCNPAANQPRYFSRYSLFPKGEFVPNGRSDRTAVLIDVEPTETADETDEFLRMKPKSDFELAWALRALARGVELDANIEEATGLSRKTLIDLMDRMKRAKYGAIVFDQQITQGSGYLNSEALLALASDMNRHTRFVVRPMRAAGNVAGADNVLCWSTGYQFGVGLGRGYPRYNPGEFTATEMLARGEVDAALLVGLDPTSDLSPGARDYLTRIKTVVLDSGDGAPSIDGAVVISTSTLGIQGGDTVYRMDDVPLPVRPVLTSRYRSDYEILTAIEERIRGLT